MSVCLLFFGMAIPYFHCLKRRQGRLLLGWLYPLSEDVLSLSRVPNFLPCLILGTDTFTLLLCPIFLVPTPPLDKETSSDLLLQLYLIGKIRTRKQLVSLLTSHQGHAVSWEMGGT